MSENLKAPPRLRVWYCKIGESELPVGGGADYPMRDAVERAYERITGKPSDFTFSGWGQELTESERAVYENRMPDRDKQIAEAREQLRRVEYAPVTEQEPDALPQFVCEVFDDGDEGPHDWRPPVDLAEWQAVTGHPTEGSLWRIRRNPSPASRELRDALELIQRLSISCGMPNAQEQVEARVMCDDPWHTKRPHERGEGNWYCPACYSQWWSVDGEMPASDSAWRYGLGAIARAALEAEPPKPHVCSLCGAWTEREGSHQPEHIPVTDEMIDAAQTAVDGSKWREYNASGYWSSKAALEAAMPLIVVAVRTKDQAALQAEPPGEPHAHDLQREGSR